MDHHGNYAMKLESWHSTEDKRRWKIVRTDDYTDVAGDIITADEATGECCIQVGGETKTLSFGPRGIRVVGKRRRTRENQPKSNRTPSPRKISSRQRPRESALIRK